MELVYPIYLDTPMMTAFLASLEGGLVEEADLESRTTDSKEKAGAISLGGKVSGLITSILDIEAKGDIARKVSENLESHYKSTVRFPSAALFIRLRELLVEQNLMAQIKSADDFEDMAIGSIVEFQGLVIANPSYQIRQAFNQILPLLGPIYDVTAAQLEQQLAQLKDAKPQQKLKLGNEEITFENTQHIKTIRALLENKKHQSQNESVVYQALGKVVTRLFPEDAVDDLVFKADGFQAIARVYPALARDQRIQDVHDANWHCVGKVIGIVEENSIYDLLKSSPITYFVKDQFPTFARALNNENLNVQTTEPKIKGPAIIVAPLAIFA